MKEVIDAKSIVSYDEKVLWEDRPNRKGLILESVFTPMLIFATIWGLFDLLFFKNFFSGGMAFFFDAFDAVFILIHMMPVWIYLGGVIISIIKSDSIRYILTEKALYVVTPKKSVKLRKYLITDMDYITFSQGSIDRKFGVGDVEFKYCKIPAKIDNIKGFKELVSLLNKLKASKGEETEEILIAEARINEFSKANVKEEANPLDH